MPIPCIIDESAPCWAILARGANNLFMYMRTDKKENQIFLINKEIQSGEVAKSYMTNGLLIYGEIFEHFLIY